MLSLLELVCYAVACAAALPCAVFFVECLFGSLWPLRKARIAAVSGPRFAVLVPAHNESSGITGTLEGLLAQLGASDRLVVVADNCSDDTAAIAARSGATVIERHDPERRGKGYALAFGLEHLAQDPPEVVIIVDADCQVSPGSLAQLAQLARDRDRPVQADYVLEPPERPEGKAVISALAFLVKNRVRPRGLAALGLPCLLTGTGMAFPWTVIRKAPPTEDNLVEDMVMGLALAQLGHAPILCPDARVSSALPDRTQAAQSQRKRWEHGHLATLIEYGPKLLLQGIARARLELIALALDLMVPPLSLLVALILASLLFTAGSTLLGASAIPALISLGNLAALGCGVLLGWFVHGRSLVRARDLAAIPFYVLWKIPLYFTFFARGRHTRWERTERKP
ncbi:MAG TPA: glycosyltransferase family 2 protein [Polyangiales bacterium]|nr:glycosyltransferase family 2 protein [Polyangiales bacterium]